MYIYVYITINTHVFDNILEMCCIYYTSMTRICLEKGIVSYIPKFININIFYFIIFQHLCVYIILMLIDGNKSTLVRIKLS